MLIGRNTASIGKYRGKCKREAFSLRDRAGSSIRFPQQASKMERPRRNTGRAVTIGNGWAYLPSFTRRMAMREISSSSSVGTTATLTREFAVLM